jgi:hypothetical protein
MSREVGNIAELRQLIFSFVGTRDLAACAKVCRAWTEDASDGVWAELPSLSPLLGLVEASSLCPTMTWDRDAGQVSSTWLFYAPANFNLLNFDE